MNKWRLPSIPRHVVQMIPIDNDGNVLVMHRSNNVRSARNVWSFPTGLHDIGETIKQTIERELDEEYGLSPYEHELIGNYENIAGDPEDTLQYHWVISVYLVMVESVKEATNKEPEKHDIMRTDCTVGELLNTFTFLETHKFHESFEDFFRTCSIYSAIGRLFDR